jgi:peptidoglycan/LPS O-acetylase OafA/YrhL
VDDPGFARYALSMSIAVAAVTHARDFERPPAPVVRRSLAWLEALKGAAIVWVILNHVAERVWGAPLAGNPAQNWPPLADRIAQWAPLRTGHASADIVTNALRSIGWTGDQGVTLFLLLSGLGIAYGLACKNAPATLALGAFYRARAARIFPQWWTINAFVLLTAWAIGKLTTVERPEFVLGLLGIRASAQAMYFLVPAWWYIGLILQCYLIFPLLWWAARRWGFGRMLVVSAALGFAARALGTLAFPGFVDEWLRGAYFITRLPEFALGIAAGIAFAQSPERVARILRAPLALSAAFAALALGFGLSFTLAGMVVAPFLMGAGIFGLGYAAFARLSEPDVFGRRRKPDALTWLGRHSYALYLVHQPLVNATLPAHDAALPRILGGLAAAIVGSVLAGVLLERVTAAIVANLRTAAVFGAIALAAVYGANAFVAAAAPQEVYGWGERPSLVPDRAVGWKLAPSQTTRLRWHSYDYVMQANALGFPAPEVPASKPAGVTRIMTTGNAFTSGEGIDRNLVWPRLLERKLDARHTPAQVLNFGITGHGPTQFAAVIRTYAPRVHPDVIIVEMFTKEYDTVLLDDDALRKDIGFGNPDPLGFRATAEAAQLGTYLRETIGDRVRTALGRPLSTSGAFYADVSAFDLHKPELARSRALVSQRLAEMQSEAGRLHAKLYVVMVPASVQVCSAADLPYYPKGIFNDAARYDLDLPQRMTHQITAQLGIQFLDLRAALENGACPYWKTNMHWTVAGQQLASDAIAQMILSSRH